eukprot:TRINITY_DN4343_c0_g1_i1.p1 TRINITY_DN4343_c0_g1~~TRINITY_DN4343_c0_g1_i1.p1  ORF type:complete len:350 (+),score=31.38 TRINITY_DN4343_c0_g1_i1:35-1084(+)
MPLNEVNLRDDFSWARVGPKHHTRFETVKGDMLWLLGSEEGSFLADAVVTSKSGKEWKVHTPVVCGRLGVDMDKIRELMKPLTDATLGKALCWVYTGNFGVKYLTEEEMEALRPLMEIGNVRNPFGTGLLDRILTTCDGGWADVEVRSDDGVSYWGSKAVLSARCPFFQELFTPGKWADGKVVDLEVKGTALGGVWGFLKSNGLGSVGGLEELYGMVEIADFFDLERLRTEVEKKIAAHLTPQNLPALWNIIDDLNAPTAHALATSCFTENFVEATSHPTFPSLRKHLFLDSLKEGSIDAPTPCVIAAIDVWCEHNAEPKTDFLPPNTFLNKDTKDTIMNWDHFMARKY